MVRIIALLVVIPLLVKIVRRPHSEPVREGPPASSPSNSELAAQSAQSALIKKGDEDWNRHKAEHRIIHDYSRWKEIMTESARLTSDFLRRIRPSPCSSLTLH